MSYSKCRPTYYNATSIQGQLLNTFVSAHDLTCGCDHPIEHIIWTTATKGKPTRFTDEEKKKLKECLGFGEDPTIKEEETTGLDTGDLEKLFAHDDDEEDTG